MSLPTRWSATLNKYLYDSSQENFEKALKAIQLSYAVNFCAFVTKCIEAYYYIIRNGAQYSGPQVSVSDLKQAFYLALPEFKDHYGCYGVPAFAWDLCCWNVLHYGIEHYPDSGFQEMKHNFEEWIKESDKF